MNCAHCPGTCQSAAMQAALSQLTRLTAELAKAVADIRVEQLEITDRLNAHSQWLERLHREGQGEGA